jgi:hypothetical protein
MMSGSLPVRMALILALVMVLCSEARLGGRTKNVPLDDTKNNRQLDSSSSGSNGDSSSGSSQISAYQQWINSYKYGYKQQQNQYQNNGNDYSQYSSYSNNNYNNNNNNYNNDDAAADDQVSNQAASGNGYYYNDDGANANDDGANAANDDNADDGANSYSNGDDAGGSSSSSSTNSGMDVQSDSGGTTENQGWMSFNPSEWLSDERNMGIFKMVTGLVVSVVALMTIYICYLQCMLRRRKAPALNDSLLTIAPESHYQLDKTQPMRHIRESGEVLENPAMQRQTNVS